MKHFNDAVWALNGEGRVDHCSNKILEWDRQFLSWKGGNTVMGQCLDLCATLKHLSRYLVNVLFSFESCFFKNL